MIVLDNSSYIISEIDKDAKKDAKKIQKEMDSKESKLKAEFDKKRESSLNEISQYYVHKKELLFKQKMSEFALKQQRVELNAQQETFSQVTSNLKEMIEDLPTKEKNAIVKGMVAMLEVVSTSKIKEFLIPKGCKITQKHKANQSNFIVIGVVNSHEEYEYSLDEMLKKHSNFIKELIFSEDKWVI